MDSICTSVCIQWLCIWWLLFPVSDQPICGNQIVEEGEECDVGHNDSDACCYSATHPVGVQCRLKPGKVCRCHTQDMSVDRCWGWLKRPFLISSFVLWSKSQSGSVLQANLWVPASRSDLRRGDRLSERECVSRLLPWLPGAQRQGKPHSLQPGDESVSEWGEAIWRIVPTGSSLCLTGLAKSLSLSKSMKRSNSSVRICRKSLCNVKKGEICCDSQH